MKSKQLIKSVLGTFTTEYTKHYALQLVALKEEESEADEPKYALKEREPLKEDIMSGYLTKEGAARKNWKKRFFVVRHDYTVDYFVDEKAFKAGKKPKGTMSLCGYRVEEDIEGGALKKARALMEKMKIEAELPEPKKYPPHTFQVEHPRRRCYFITAPDEAEKKKWVEMFETCCRRAYGFKNQERCHRNAFSEAVRSTRWELGRWGWWSWGGSEVQVLSDLISDEIDYVVMGKVYDKLSGSWSARNMVRNQALKMIDTMVSAAVAPAWEAMSSAAETARKVMEPKIAEMVDPLAKTKQALLDKVQGACMSVLTPLLEKGVNPHVKDIVRVVTAPVKDAFEAVGQMWDEKIDSWAETADRGDPTTALKDITKWGYYARPSEALDLMRQLYDPLWALRTVFRDIRPWSLLWRGWDELCTLQDSAAYTFEEEVRGLVKDQGLDGSTAIARAKSTVQAKLRKDIEARTVNFYTDIVKAIVMPPLEDEAMPACKSLLAPLDDAVPEPMKEFVNITKLFERLVDNLVTDAIGTVLRSAFNKEAA
eukprot:Sspe_Gene.29611::Locus_14156_Transcript_1_1_Confidence_1.000_Length_1758::g.29611::m.29611